ncbi:hypothetical protein GOODEAATRI_029639, partial [Goodea atripinnis]
VTACYEAMRLVENEDECEHETGRGLECIYIILLMSHEEAEALVGSSGLAEAHDCNLTAKLGFPLVHCQMSHTRPC